MKKLFFWAALFVILPQISKASDFDFNKAKALQMSLYFYDAEKSGPGISGGRLEWRGDSEVEDAYIPLTPDMTNLSAQLIEKYRPFLDPDGNGTMDLSGGMHDAGDHVKFGLPQSYSSSTLEWAFYEFRDAFDAVGNTEHMRDILKWFSDYYLRSTFTDGNGDVVAFCYQVGEGGIDHNYWGPPEIQDPALYKRPAYFATEDTPASDQTAGAAASLALTYLNFKDYDPAYANKCLTAAKGLYEFSTKYRGLGYSGGFYGSSFDQDELCWAAIWLHIATDGKEYDYLEDILRTDGQGHNIGWLGKIVPSEQDEWQNIWVHSWDTKWGGVFSKLATLTNDPIHWYYFRWNLEYWFHIPHLDAGDGSYLAKTDQGFSFLNSWGSARYNAAAQMQALVYSKHTGDMRFADAALEQMNYIMGDNIETKSGKPRCYMVGFAENSAKNPHHRASHGSESNSTRDPEVQKHVLWGALVGGPGLGDEHDDITADYVYNEVAIDYNAGFVGALAGHYYFYATGDETLLPADFPPTEGPQLEYFVETRLEAESKERSQISLRIHNSTVHYPRVHEGIKVRYFFSAKEMIDAGQKVSEDLKLEIYYDQGSVAGEPTTVNGPLPWNIGNGTYYLEFDWSDYKFYGDRDIQFALVAGQDDVWQSHWDPSNDHSHVGIEKDTFKILPNVAVYIDDALYYGSEPDSGGMNSPVAIIKPSAKEGEVPFTVTLDGSNSYDPDIDDLTYLWTLPNGVTKTTPVISTTFEDLGEYVVTLQVTDSKGLTGESSITLKAVEPGMACNYFSWFDVPRATPLTSTGGNKEYNNVHVDGDGAPNVSRIIKFGFNWDLQNNGLYQIAIYTSNGIPNYYVDLNSAATHTFGQSSPMLTLSGSGLAGFDNTYYVNYYGDGIALVQKDGDYVIVFDNNPTLGDCSAPKAPFAKKPMESTPVINPNPVTDYVTFYGIEDVQSIEIINAAGMLVKVVSLEDEQMTTIDISELPAGVYNASFLSKNGGIEAQKFIKH
ncbi:MAG: glycoside hydrolase family 9 protein [Bacteroidales bacterium]|nr:glycoside hydrolase family 9 protein [Bacteroidales bacterium]